MRMAIRALVAMALLAVFATGGVRAAGQDHSERVAWKEALRIRSEGLNRVYQLGDFKPSWKRALRIRSDGLNRYSGRRAR